MRNSFPIRAFPKKGDRKLFASLWRKREYRQAETIQKDIHVFRIEHS